MIEHPQPLVMGNNATIKKLLPGKEKLQGNARNARHNVEDKV